MISASVWNATVKRHLLELTPRGMMVQLIAEADDPFRLKRKSQVKPKNKLTSENTLINTEGTANSESPPTPQTSNMPLFVGAFVDVSIPGRQLENVVNIPAQALRDQDTVWIALEGELAVRRVKIAHLDQDNIYLSGGVKQGEQIIISPIKGAANGLKIRIAGKEKTEKMGKEE
jgi:multidrug efflux pump subunit AcrA (membrane-fusion protein)